MSDRLLFGDVRIPFGTTYRGVKLKDLPLKRLDWYIREFEDGANWTLNYPDFHEILIDFSQQEEIQLALKREFDDE